ncbi:MAG: hypothetical protein M3162_08560 [Thermoproteota archaeon]|nr:hypothetical protein [Thermoproteota archaeon]
MSRKNLKEIYVSKETHRQLKELCGNIPIGKFIESLLKDRKEDLHDLLLKRNEEISIQYKNLFFDLNKIIGLYISILNNSSALFNESIKNSVISHIKQILDTESCKIDEILKNIRYYDRFDSDFHKGILDLSVKYRQLIVSRTSVTFEEEEIISRYLFEKNKIYSGITFNPIEFYKDRTFYLKLHERLLFFNSRNHRKKMDSYYNCRIVLTDLNDLKSKVYAEDKSTNQLNFENLLNLWLFIKWHKDHNVHLYYVPIDTGRNKFQKYSSTLWTMKMGIFFGKYLLLMGLESPIENRLEREIQIVDSTSDKYDAGVSFFSELHDYKEDFEKVMHEEIPEIAFQSLNLSDTKVIFDCGG